MKNFLTNISQDEKKRILEMHNKYKRILNELEEPEPVFNEETTCTASFLFKEGETSFSLPVQTEIKNFISGCIKSSISTIQKFHDSAEFKLPPFVTFYVGTSHTGDFSTNRKVAQKRLEFLSKLFIEVMTGGFGIREDIAYKLFVGSDQTYQPSKLDRSFYDPSKVKPNDTERICHIVIKPISTEGLENPKIDDIRKELDLAGGDYDVDEETIVKLICSLETFSDIVSLDRKMTDGLQWYLNHNLTISILPYGSDDAEQQQVINCLNRASKNSGKGEVAKKVGDKISINLNI